MGRITNELREFHVPDRPIEGSLLRNPAIEGAESVRIEVFGGLSPTRAVTMFDFEKAASAKDRKIRSLNHRILS
jgi:hypothetical protein